MPTTSRAIVWVAHGYVSAPSQGQVFHTGDVNLFHMNVTITSADHHVFINSGTPGTTYNLTWLMELDCSSITVGRDVNPGTFYSFVMDQTGFWEHKANGSGSISDTLDLNAGPYTATAYSEIKQLNFPYAQDTNEGDDDISHDFSVARP